jgi:hypothetical protein
MAPFAAWQTGSQNWDSPSHERLEGRCRITGTRSRLGEAGYLALTGYGWPGLLASTRLWLLSSEALH